MVGIGSQVARVNHYFLERFLELSYHFLSKSKGKILDDFAFLLNFETVIVTITSSMFTVLPTILSDINFVVWPRFYVTKRLRAKLTKLDTGEKGQC